MFHPVCRSIEIFYPMYSFQLCFIKNFLTHKRRHRNFSSVTFHFYLITVEAFSSFKDNTVIFEIFHCKIQSMILEDKILNLLNLNKWNTVNILFDLRFLSRVLLSFVKYEIHAFKVFFKELRVKSLIQIKFWKSKNFFKHFTRYNRINLA